MTTSPPETNREAMANH